MISSQKRAEKLLEYYFLYPELRKMMFEYKSKFDTHSSEIYPILTKIRKFCSGIDLELGEEDWFISGLYKIYDRSPKGRKDFYSSGCIAGLDGLVPELWKFDYPLTENVDDFFIFFDKSGLEDLFPGCIKSCLFRQCLKNGGLKLFYDGFSKSKPLEPEIVQIYSKFEKPLVIIGNDIRCYTEEKSKEK